MHYTIGAAPAGGFVYGCAIAPVDADVMRVINVPLAEKILELYNLMPMAMQWIHQFGTVDDDTLS